MKKTMWKNCIQKKLCEKFYRWNCRHGDINYKNINYKQLITMMNKEKGVVLLDVRSKQEYIEGHINGAVSFPLFEIERNAESILQNKQTPIIIYCSSGVRSIRAIQILLRRGYTNLYNLEGGIDNY